MADRQYWKAGADSSRLRALLTRFHRITRRTGVLEDKIGEVIDCPPELLGEAPVRGLMRSCLSLSMRKQLLHAIHEADHDARAGALAKAFSAYMLLQGRAPRSYQTNDAGEFTLDSLGLEEEQEDACTPRAAACG